MHRRQQALAEGGDVGQRPGQQAQGRQAFAQAVGVAVQAQRCFERCERGFADAQRALQRVFLDLRDQLLLADDQPGLRATEQLVAGEGDDVGAGRQRLLRRRLGWQAEGGEIGQRATAEVDNERQPGIVGDFCHFLLVDRSSKAGDHVVAGMHLHQQRRLRADGLGIVPGVRAVGGADFDQLHLRPTHHVGDAEGATDLDQFAA